MPDEKANPDNYSEVLEWVRRGEDLWQNRWTQVADWRDDRYGDADVLSLIPFELRATDYEYHDDTYNRAILDGASFLSASNTIWTVDPPTDRNKGKADDIEAVLRAVFDPGGIMDTEANHDVSMRVWEGQLEAGRGIYKMVVKRSYPLGMPQRRYEDDDDEEVPYEDNPDFRPQSRKATRQDRKETKLRETDTSLKERREEFEKNEFPFQWNYVDERTYFELTLDGVPFAAGEINARPASILDEHGLGRLKDKKEWVYTPVLGEGKPKSSATAETHQQVKTVNTFELWTPSRGYFGFLSHGRVGEGGTRIAAFSEDEEYWTWQNPMNRIPYFVARGMPTTHDQLALSMMGAFTTVQGDTSLVNYLETMIFNATHRNLFPKYQAVIDPTYKQERLPLNTEAQKIVDDVEMQDIDLPPGWVWQPIDPGSELDLHKQLADARERMEDDALAAVLTGRVGANASGAQVSLRINAAERALSPIVRNHQIPLSEMGQTMLETARRLKMPLNVETAVQGEAQTRTVKKLSLSPDDIITTQVTAFLDPALPVDQAARETRGMALMAANRMSYETGAPRFFGIGDPQKEQARIDLDIVHPMLVQFAAAAAMQQLEAAFPEVFRDMMGRIGQTEGPMSQEGEGVGGGPGGSFGGAAAMIGRGSAALAQGQVRDDVAGGVSARPRVQTQS